MSSKVEKFGKYILCDKIASGGMAEIWRAWANGADGIGRLIAIKRILPNFSSDQNFVEMFKSEAKIAMNIHHTNIATIFEFGEQLRQFFLVMEYIDGRNLRQISNQCTKSSRTLTIEQVVYILAEVAHGLDYAHRCTNKNTGAPLNVIHRDMSPQNIMVSFEGEVKIVDFGIAKAESRIENTKAGTLKGKFGYMSPEQVEGLELDNRTDIFSTGIVLWEMLATERLFVANNEVNTIRKIRECQVPPLRKINPAIPEELERITGKALAKDRSLRYQTGAELSRDLRKFLNKVNPEFTPHELANFVKIIFKDAILDDRKKVTEFLKAASIESNDDTIVTANNTTTFTETGKDEPVQVKPSSSQAQSQSGAETKSAPANQGPESFSFNIDPIEIIKGRTNTSYNSRPSGTSTSVRTKGTRTGVRHISGKSKTKVLFSAGIRLGLIGFIGFSAYHGYKNSWFKIPFSGSGKTELSSQGQQGTPAPIPTPQLQSRVYLTTAPMGSRIYIDDQDMNTLTPAEITLPINKSVNIQLKKDGYNDIAKTFSASKPVEELFIALQKAPFGYLDIEVIPANAEIFVGGRKVSAKSPAKRVQVPANQTIEVLAINKFLNIYAKTTVAVKQDSVKTIKLYPKKVK